MEKLWKEFVFFIFQLPSNFSKPIFDLIYPFSMLNFESIKVKEQEVLQKITDKYGPGTLDPNTGVFTPSKS